MSPDAHRMHMPASTWPCNSPQLLCGARGSVCAPSARCRLFCPHLAMPASAMQQVKRAFVTAINALAGRHGVEVHSSCDSPDAGLRSAYRQVLFRVHPDRCGNGEEQKRLNAAHEAWVQAVTAAKGRGRPHAAQWGGADAGGSGAMTFLWPTEQGRPRQATFKAFKKVCMEVARKRGAASRA